MTAAYLDPFAQIIDLHKPPVTSGMTAVLVLELHQETVSSTYTPDEHGPGLDGQHYYVSGELWLYEVTDVETTGIDDSSGHRYAGILSTYVDTLDGVNWRINSGVTNYASPLLAMQAHATALASLTGSSATVLRKVKVDDYVYTEDFVVQYTGSSLFLSGVIVQVNAPAAIRLANTDTSVTGNRVANDYRRRPSAYTRNDTFSKNYVVPGAASNTPSIYPEAAPRSWFAQDSSDYAFDGVATRFTYADKTDYALLYTTISNTYNKIFDSVDYGGGFPGHLVETLWDFKCVPVIVGQTLSNSQRSRTIPLVTTWNFVRQPPYSFP